MKQNPRDVDSGTRSDGGPERGEDHAPRNGPRIEEAIESSSRSISPRTIERSGIRRLRVLSESHFHEILARVVASKLEERVRAIAAAARPARRGADAVSAGDPAGDLVPAAPPPPDVIAVRDRCRQLLEERRRRDNERIASIEARLDRLAGTLGSLESTLAALADRLGS